MNSIKGELFVLRDLAGQLINDIDTDQIFHNQYLSIVDISKMGAYTLDNLEGYRDFAKKAKPGMIVVTGENFGSGSSRQQAVDCFISLEMAGIVAFSYGAIYKRNAINTGFPIIEVIEIDKNILVSGKVLEFNAETGEIIDDSGKVIGSCRKFSNVQKELILKKGLLNSAE